ncbi:MAG: PstA family ABC transporter permease [Thermoplasmata archaeon]
MRAHGPEEEELRPAPGSRLLRRLRWDRWVGRLLWLPFLLVLVPIGDLLYWVSSRAVPTLRLTTLTTNPSGFGGGLYAPITGTVMLMLLAGGIASVLGILAGMYTAEFATPWTASLARLGGNLLAGVPAIVVGYFGYFALVLYLGWGYSLLAGALTLSFFMLPYIYRTADLAFSSVPREQREAAQGAGATPAQYLRRVAWPIALPRILSGVFVALAIGLGETAPLLFTAGWNNAPAAAVTSPTSYLTGLIWLFYDFPSSFGTEQTLAFQAAFLLIMSVIALNVVIQIVAERARRKLRGIYR